MKNQALVTTIGLILFALYLLQFFLGLEWNWLAELQNRQMYKRWSGLLLAVFILFQWMLTFSRVIKKLRKHSIKVTTVHKWAGAFSPILFYVHSIALGYGYLLLLGYLFFANMLLGQLNLDVIKNNSELLFKGWMISHVGLSMVITFLMFFHIGMVFYYK